MTSLVHLTVWMILLGHALVIRFSRQYLPCSTPHYANDYNTTSACMIAHVAKPRGTREPFRTASDRAQSEKIARPRAWIARPTRSDCAREISALEQARDQAMQATMGASIPETLPNALTQLAKDYGAVPIANLI